MLTAVAAVSIAFGAMLGAATAPSADAQRGEAGRPGDLQPVDPQPATGQQAYPLDENAAATLVDADGDGVPDLDADGNPVIAFDADGDGEFEGRLMRCPSTATDVGLRPTTGIDGDQEVVAIDFDCDGTIDRIVPVQPWMLQQFPGADNGIGEGQLGPSAEAGAPGGGDNSADDPPDNDSGGGLEQVLLTLLGVVAVGALLLVVVRYLRSRDGREPDESPGDAREEGEKAAVEVDAKAVDAAIAVSIDTLLGHPDPRVAVRAAYAVLLDALAEAGFARRSFEAPEEHLTRCLHGLGIEPAPMRELLRLFTLARFSTHDITEVERQQAFDALQASQDLLRRRLAAPVAPGAGWDPPRPG